MSERSIWRPILQDITRFNRAEFALETPLRNAIGVLLPLVIGVPLGQTAHAATMSLSALLASFTDFPGPYRRRAGWMLLATINAAIWVLLGSLTSGIPPLSICLLALNALVAGMFTLWGPVALQVGLNGVLAMLLLGSTPLSLSQAVVQVALVLGGSLFQIGLSVFDWPVRRYQPERASLARLFGALAHLPDAPIDPDRAPLTSAEITASYTILNDLAYASDGRAQALLVLLNQGERIRVELLALERARQQLDIDAGDARIREHAAQLRHAAQAVLGTIATTLTRHEKSAVLNDQLDALTTAGHALHACAISLQSDVVRGEHERLLAHADALAGELRAAAEMLDRLEGQAASTPIVPGLLQRQPPSQIQAVLSMLRANLTWKSQILRHALRMALCVAVASAIAHGLTLQRGFWVPMTAAIVLRPDFSATLSRMVGRIGGTLVGLLIATVLAYLTLGLTPAMIILIGIAVLLTRSVALFNFALFTTGVTVLVVLLLALLGADPQATIIQRSINSLLGSAIALVVYLCWPTWEQRQTPQVLARLLDAYRAYFAAVIDEFLQPRSTPHIELDTARLAARRARSNAEASIGRLQSEPTTSSRKIGQAHAILANSHRFVNAALELEAWLYSYVDQQSNYRDPLQRFARDVDQTLQALVRSLQDGARPPDDLPNLRLDQNALLDLVPPPVDSARPDHDHSAYLQQTLIAETERITNSLNTLTFLIRKESYTTTSIARDT